MGAGRALPDPAARDRRAAYPLVARGVRRPALRGAPRHPVAGDAPRPAAVARRVRPGDAVAAGGLLRDAGARPAGGAAPGGGARGGAFRRHPGQPDPAQHARERRARGGTGTSARAAPSCTWPWTHSATCSRSTSPPPARTTARRWPSRPRPSRTPPARTSRWPTSTRAIPVSGRPRPPGRTASSWRWSHRPRRSGGPSCCPAGGWSSVPSPGWPAAAGSPATTSACPRRWPASTSSPSPTSCSGAPETWPWSITRSKQPLALVDAEIALLLGFLGQAAPVGILQRLEALELARGDDHGHRSAVALDPHRLALGVVEQLAEALLGLLGGHGLHGLVS